jgi:hypothetical protein
MTKLMTLLFIFPTLLFSQELTADTPAVAVGLWPQILAALGEALTVAIKAAVTALALKAIPLLNAYLKQVMHFRGASVVADALTESIADMSAELQKALADGVITNEERAKLKNRAREVAYHRLQSLSGFYKKEMLQWIDDRLNIELAKLLAHTLG